MLSFIFQYGALWRRGVALVLDLILLSLIGILLLDPLLIDLGWKSAHEMALRIPISVDIVRGYGIWMVTMLIISWLYFAMLECSRRQATIGKRLLGIMVFSSEEKRIGFWQATVRFWVKLLSVGTGLFGFFLAVRDPKSQTLHDRVASTLVLQARSDVLGQYIEA